MIAFSCAHCGMKLQVQDQFAGRQSKCPTCKQPLVVPMPSATVAYVPPRQIDGEESSLAKAGLDGGVTLDNDQARKPTAVEGQRHRSVGEALAQRQKNGQRYVVEGEIARGGMGAVLRAVDCDIRREVAVKYMLDDKDPKKKARFIEEAQINGQLEHPNIVPVYDLGIDAQKRPFIMMKMVKGRSLKDALDQLRDNPKQAEKEYTLGRLLNILVNVCNALAFAHARGVVHRDLKPANIMLGDFGEVYVMDWGLAKVLNQPGTAEKMPQAVAAAPGASVPGRNSKVVTNRGPEADLTQEGSVLGTPVYMPPEQATGNLNAIDQRSDVYSLGAILYEVLTLQPPVEKEGGYLAVLMRVMEGEIQPPEQRAPKRAWNIPKELSAIAMKALAKEKEKRYPTVDALRQDVERFQEGRSVSAKEDSKREMLWKFVKRNKGFSAGVGAAILVLLFSSWFLFQAWRVADKNYTDYRNAQEDKQRQAKDAVPSLTKAIKLMIAEGNVDEAMVQAKAAVDADPDYAEARLLKAQLLLGNREFAAADQELARCLELRPNDAEARKLVELCRKTKPEDASALLVLSEELSRQKRHALADRITKTAQGMVKSREELLGHYRKRIDGAWPGLGGRLTVDQEGRFHLNLYACTEVRDVAPLQGMKLTSLLLGFTQVRDLSPLKGMPLTKLELRNLGGLRDLSPLKDMPLSTLEMPDCHSLQDLTPLRGMKITKLAIWGSSQIRDLTPLEELPLKEISVGGCLANPAPLRSIKTLEKINDKPPADFWREYEAQQKGKK
ncbi:MAG: protein kinase [Gemmataceae bacterium]|nr:protein kinase [Gemmataceae bacterium]